MYTCRVRFCKYRKSSGLDDVIAHGCLGGSVRGHSPSNASGRSLNPYGWKAQDSTQQIFSIQKLVLQNKYVGFFAPEVFSPELLLRKPCVYTHIYVHINAYIYIYKLYTCTRASREVCSCFIFSFGHPSFVNLYYISYISHF